MRIAQIAPLVESVPPTLYGGTERVVSWLTEELVALGHEVTLFASGDSVTKATLEPIVPCALRLAGIHNSTPYNIIMLDQVAARQDAFDVLHFHIDFFHYPLFRRLAHKTLTTLHGRQDLPELPDIYRAFPHMPLVSISNHQRKPVPPVNWRGTVYHGLPEDLLKEGGGEGGYLAFLGRICADKGILPAIEIAGRAGLPSRWRPRWIRPTMTISKNRSGRCWKTARMWNSSARSRMPTSRGSWARPGRCCSPSPGRSPSGW